MKIVALLVAGFVMAAPAAAVDFHYKLDLSSKDPEAFIARELQEGMWLGGAQQQLGHVEDGVGKELAHLGFAVAQRLEGTQPAYGPAIGFPIGSLGSMVESVVNSFHVFNADISAPPFVSKLGALVSVDVYALYRPELSADSQHHFLYGVGGKVTIPISDVLSWAKGSGGQKGL